MLIYCNGVGQWRKGQQQIRIQDVNITHFSKHFMINTLQSFIRSSLLWPACEGHNCSNFTILWIFFHRSSIFEIGLRNGNSFSQSEIAHKSKITEVVLALLRHVVFLSHDNGSVLEQWNTCPNFLSGAHGNYKGLGICDVTVGFRHLSLIILRVKPIFEAVCENVCMSSTDASGFN